MIETYNIITIGVLDEDKKLVGITEENFNKKSFIKSVRSSQEIR